MKYAYPIILKKGKKKIIVSVPDFDITTEGTDLADAMEMARDAIGLIGIDMEDDGESLPHPSDIAEIDGGEGVLTLVDVDFSEYRRKNETRSVKKNCTIPSWLNLEAEKAHISFSNVLQNALMEQLQLKGYSDRNNK